MAGRIELHFKEQVVKSTRYTCVSNKEGIVATWKRHYGPAFEKAQVVEFPDEDLDRYEEPAARKKRQVYGKKEVIKYATVNKPKGFKKTIQGNYGNNFR